MTSLRLVFIGSPDFAVPILDALLVAGHEIVCVYSQPPRPAGRGHKERPAPVHAFAGARGLAVRTPASLRNIDEQDAFAALDADAAVVAAYGLILPKAILDAPRLGCVNVHASLLPRWRGAAPIQRAILAGDQETGVTIMQMDEGLDTGPMLLADRLPITAETTATTLHDDLAALGARLVVQALDGLANGLLEPTPQPETGVTLAPKLQRGEGRVDWTRPAVALERTVRALNPWPGVWFEHDDQRIKLLAARVIDAGRDAEPGTVLDDKPTVACRNGSLQLLRLQRAGKGPADGADFLRGYTLPPGTKLG